jgi:hypothetical protein
VLSALVFSQFGCVDLDMPNQRPSVELDVDLDTVFSTSALMVLDTLHFTVIRMLFLKTPST